jgi:hypothetical protein
LRGIAPEKRLQPCQSFPATKSGDALSGCGQAIRKMAGNGVAHTFKARRFSATAFGGEGAARMEATA